MDISDKNPKLSKIDDTLHKILALMKTNTRKKDENDQLHLKLMMKQLLKTNSLDTQSPDVICNFYFAHLEQL